MCVCVWCTEGYKPCGPDGRSVKSVCCGRTLVLSRSEGTCCEASTTCCRPSWRRLEASVEATDMPKFPEVFSGGRISVGTCETRWGLAETWRFLKVTLSTSVSSTYRFLLSSCSWVDDHLFALVCIKMKVVVMTAGPPPLFCVIATSDRGVYSAPPLLTVLELDVWLWTDWSLPVESSAPSYRRRSLSEFVRNNGVKCRVTGYK